MDVGLFGQYVMNGLMLGMMYALVAVGFTLFFGVMDIINFAHGDVLMVGAFVALATCLGLTAAGIESPWVQLALATVAAVSTVAALGALIARTLVLPMKGAPPWRKVSKLVPSTLNSTICSLSSIRKNCCTTIWLVVSVPVLSEQITLVQPSVSTAGSTVMMAFFLAMR